MSIDRTSFSTAIQDPECKKLLTCLIFAAKTAWFSGFKACDKANLVKILKENLEFEPIVLALGSTMDDVAMI